MAISNTIEKMINFARPVKRSVRSLWLSDEPFLKIAKLAPLMGSTASKCIDTLLWDVADCLERNAAKRGLLTVEPSISRHPNSAEAFD